MHAEYSSSQQYMNHRVVQSYQFSQLIRHLTQPNDIVIACGDMNCEPSKLCYRIIKDVTGMIDAWDTHGTKVCGIFKTQGTAVRQKRLFKLYCLAVQLNKAIMGFKFSFYLFLKIKQFKKGKKTKIQIYIFIKVCCCMN